jgi:hypothetical protein
MSKRACALVERSRVRRVLKDPIAAPGGVGKGKQCCRIVLHHANAVRIAGGLRYIRGVTLEPVTGISLPFQSADWELRWAGSYERR